MSDLIDKGLSLVAETQREVRVYVQAIRAVNATLDPASDSRARRQRRYDKLRRDFAERQDAVYEHMSKVMTSFEVGLFAGGSRKDLPRDNLDLERSFRLPKGHERRIHGHRHAGVRIVQEGPSLLLALDAHRHHPEQFTEEELRPYREAVAPECEREALARGKIMKRARSSKKRRLLLKELEARYRNAS